MGSRVDLRGMTIKRAMAALRAGEFTAAELAHSVIELARQLNPRINSYITIAPDQAFAAATAADLELSRGRETNRHAPLGGIPLAVKDLIDVAGLPTTGGSRFFADRDVVEDAEVVMRLRQAGAVLTGKTNTHEIALGVTGVNPHFGAARNPWDLTRITGGSSSGSASAVAAGMCLAALGTDTGGSVRIPASLCSVVGFKPTFGRISTRGVLPLSWNLDHVGILTRSVEDAVLVYGVLAGYDPRDPVSVDFPAQGQPLPEKEVGQWRVALAVGDYVEACDREISDGLQRVAEKLRFFGALVEKVDSSWLSELAIANGRMTQADAACYHREHLMTHPDWFGEDVRQRLQAGAALPLNEYIQARRTQTEGRRRLDVLFKEFDLLILPTTPIAAPPIAGTEAVDAARLLTRFTSPFNLTGVPALSVPAGLTAGGLPFGIQLVSAPWREEMVLRAGLVLQSGLLTPPISADSK